MLPVYERHKRTTRSSAAPRSGCSKARRRRNTRPRRRSSIRHRARQALSGRRSPATSRSPTRASILKPTASTTRRLKGREIAIASLTASEAAGLPRHPPRQLPQIRARVRQRAAGDLRRQGQCSRRSTRRSSAATPSCAASSRPTRALPCPDRRRRLIAPSLGAVEFRRRPRSSATAPSEHRRDGKARDLLQHWWLSAALIAAAAPSDLHLLLLARRRGALLGLHAGAPMGRRQRVGRLGNFAAMLVRSRLLELDLAQPHLRGRRAPASRMAIAWCWRCSPTASCAARASTARVRLALRASPRRRSAWRSASSWRPKPASRLHQHDLARPVEPGARRRRRA